MSTAIEVASAAAIALFAAATWYHQLSVSRSRDDPRLSARVINIESHRQDKSWFAVSDLYVCNPGPTPVIMDALLTSAGEGVLAWNAEAKRQQEMPVLFPAVIAGHSCWHARVWTELRSHADEFVILYSTTRRSGRRVRQRILLPDTPMLG